MIEKHNVRIEGYYGLIDLPGTIGAAVFGNAGCFGCETSDVFMEAEILTRDGVVITCSKDNMRFERRSSALKSKLINGVILSVKLKKQKGNTSEIKAKAGECHRQRLETQPGPQNNLGSCFMSGKRTFFYKVLQKVIHTYLRITRQPLSKSLSSTLVLLYKHLIPYLYDMNRFMWLDEKAQDVFEDYICLYKKIYKGAELEINVYK